jgi:hypothetical protein
MSLGLGARVLDCSPIAMAFFNPPRRAADERRQPK